jgi:hypothetical protein
VPLSFAAESGTGEQRSAFFARQAARDSRLHDASAEKLKVKLTWCDEDTRMIQSMTIEGRHFELTVREQPHGDWHWLITAPGQLVLSGNAPSELKAQEWARDAARALARLAAA